MSPTFVNLVEDHGFISKEYYLLEFWPNNCLTLDLGPTNLVSYSSISCLIVLRVVRSESRVG